LPKQRNIKGNNSSNEGKYWLLANIKHHSSYLGIMPLLLDEPKITKLSQKTQQSRQANFPGQCLAWLLVITGPAILRTSSISRHYQQGNP